MRWSNRWKKAGLSAALLAAVAAPLAIHAVRAAPEPPADRTALPAQVAAGKTFAPICKDTTLVDARPDPAWVGASFENDHCQAPGLPAPLNGFIATRAQIVNGMAAAKRYVALADTYQKCVGDFVAARQAQAVRTRMAVYHPLVVIENHRIFVSQKNQALANRQIEVAINAFNEYGSDCPDH
jgi:hypothetical protein